MPNIVALFNLKYSENLGDGVITLRLEQELRRHLVSWDYFRSVVSWDFRSVDSAGRTEWTTPAGGLKRAKVLWLLDHHPSWAGELVVRTVLGVELRRRLLPFYREGIRGAKFAVFRGGQLFQDGHLNFPLKISAAVAACSAAGVPFGGYGVASTESCSRTGRRLFSRVLSSCEQDAVFAREAASVARLKELGSPRPTSCLDPLLASELWPVSAARSDRRTVGLYIVHPAVHRHHGGMISGSFQAMIDRTVCLIGRLTADGYTVVCFTNGACEDELLRAKCRDSLHSSGTMGGDRVIISPRCKNPEVLAWLVASFDIVIVHRLHASILAYSYMIPAIGLEWDPKLQAFFEAVGERAAVLDLDGTSSDEIASKIAAALAKPFPLARHRAALEQARSGVGQLADCLRKKMTGAVGQEERVEA